MASLHIPVSKSVMKIISVGMDIPVALFHVGLIEYPQDI